MLRNRIIFVLIYSNGRFMQSRNFRLQQVGDLQWLSNNYQFQKISFSLDELIVLNATRDQKDIAKFSRTVGDLAENVFLPIAAGGGIRSMQDAEILYGVGVDKIVLNTALYENRAFVEKLVQRYGSQSIVASIDYKLTSKGPVVYISDGSVELPLTLREYLGTLHDAGVGEILLNSIDRDGTGFGYDVETVLHYGALLSEPLIVMGGAGNEKHLEQGLSLGGVNAVATANLFNFIGDGLPRARSYLLAKGANLAKWTDVPPLLSLTPV